MAADPAQGVGAHRTYRHEAFLYAGDDEFLASTVPFVLDGLARQQPVMVAVAQPRLDRLRAALGADAAAVRFVDMAELGANPARIIPAWRDFVEESGGPVRGIGEPVWAGRPPDELAECQLHEALLNVAVEPDTPLWLICPYEAAALSADVLEEAARSHPVVRQGQDYRGSTTYGGAWHADELFAADLPAPPADVTARPFGAADVADVRRQVSDHAEARGLPPARTADLVVAASEVAGNSVRHAGGRGTLRLWSDADTLACEVVDAGRISDPLVGRRVPALSGEGGRGLWLANQLCDLVQVRSHDAGTTVRLLSRL